MRNRFLLGAGVALAMALSWADAQAQLLVPPSGPGTWYFGGQVGWTSLDSEKGGLARNAVPGGGGALSVKENWNNGINTGVRGGYEWGPWRFEEEFGYQTNGLNSLSLSAPSPGWPAGSTKLVNGDRQAYAFMTNAIYDFNAGWVVTPHLGFGVGAVILHDGASTQVGAVIHPGGGKFASNSQTEFGYQGIAGIRYNINPSLAFDLDYRYLATDGASFKAAALPFTPNKYHSGYASNNLVASLTVRFGAALPILPPPAPPAPPPMARKVFLVFFDWDKSTITPEGMAIIHQAADVFQHGGPVTIQVTGYTDSSGSAGYNQRLSERRATAVAQAMVGMGVPRNQMAVSGRGENDQRVPTANGVREPQNRRVEILFP